VSADDQDSIGGFVNTYLLDIDFVERQMRPETPQQMLRRVAEYSEPASIVQSINDNPSQIISLQRQIAHLQAEQFLPP